MKGFRVLGEKLFSLGLTQRLGLGQRHTAGGDTTAPTVVITCAQSSPSGAATLNFTITFSEVVTGFVLGDITVSNGTAGNFAGSGAVYTCDITPIGMSVITVDVAGSVCIDAAGNSNTAATQFTFTSTAPFSDAFTRADGAIGSIWTGATWTIASNAVLNTPTEGGERVVNGGFDADTDWTKDAGWTIASGVASVVGAANGLSIQQLNRLTAGLWYVTRFDITNRTQGNLRLYFGDGYNYIVGLSNGSFVISGRAQTNGHIKLYTSGTSTYDVDNVSYKPVTLATLFASLPDVGVAAVTAQVIVTINPAGRQGGLVINLDSISTPANFVIAYLDGTNAKLDKCVAGTYTNVISGAVTFGATKNLKLVKSGNNYSLYYGTPGSETQVGTTQAITSMNGTIHGLFVTNNTPKFDTYQLAAT